MDATTTAPVPLTAHLAAAPDSGEAYTPPKGIHLGRERVTWTPDVWERIDRAVNHETQRTRVTSKFLPHHRVDPHITTVPAETVLASINSSTPFSGQLQPLTTGAPTPMLNIDEGTFIRLIEIWTEFSLTSAQVQEENELAAKPDAAPDGPPSQQQHHRSSTAVTLARRATNVLCLAQDTVIFQGLSAFPVGGVGGSVLFSSQTVLNRGFPADHGLLCLSPNLLPLEQVLPVFPTNASSPPPGALAQYSENTVGAINKAYSILSANGYPGPFVCVLYFSAFADAFVPLANTLILPADRIKPLMEEGFYASVGLPGTPNPSVPPLGSPLEPQSYGLVMSLGGNVVDHVNGLDPVTAFSQVDATGNHTFRVLSRFALRLKDQGSVIRLEFQ